VDVHVTPQHIHRGDQRRVRFSPVRRRAPPRRVTRAMVLSSAGESLASHPGYGLCRGSTHYPAVVRETWAPPARNREPSKARPALIT
jgi:hypothetical protein